MAGTAGLIAVAGLLAGTGQPGGADAVRVETLRPEPAADAAPAAAAYRLTLDPAMPGGDADGSSSLAAPAARGAWRVRSLTLAWNNDGAYAKPIGSTDHHYTNGVRAEVALDPAWPEAWRERIAPRAAWDKTAVSFGVQQHMYTASDIAVANPAENDRPYAGYLAFSAAVQRANDTTHDHLELSLGVVGSRSGAEDLQVFIHSVFPQEVRPNGWGTQLKNELAVQARAARTWRSPIAEVGGPGGLEMQALPRVSADLGNVFVRAGADMTVRLGKHLPDDFGPGRLLDGYDATGEWTNPEGWGAYGFVRGGMRAVAHNIFLDGNTFADSRSVDREVLVGELEVGVQARYEAVRFRWSVTFLTDEFETQSNADSFGEWTLSIAF
jgi:hypothetical protein